VPIQVERQRASDSEILLMLAGTVDADAAEGLIRELTQLSKRYRLITLDLGGLERADSIGVATLAECAAITASRGVELRARKIPQEYREKLARVAAPEPPKASATKPFFERVGSHTTNAWAGVRSFMLLLSDTAYWSLVAPLRRRLPPPGATTEQAVRIGVDALPIVCLIAFLLGLTMAFQAAYQLRQFGANIFVANLVGPAMVRELGPLMTAIVVAGRSGSAIAAELGTMTVGEEVDALRTMGIDPTRYLVVPRVYAITITQPALALFAMIVGILGGFLIGVLYLDLSATAYIKQTLRSLDLGSLFQGLAKSLLFAWVVVLTGCYYGLRIRGGAVGVGRSTTTAVVVSIFAIIVVDSIFTTAATLLK
jgi:phospholipid/cholesterol/gamma-HCH transport system permease protein